MKNNKVPKIISFIFPIIGLIIYAVNVGKNDILAKDCLKYALYGLLLPILIFILIFIIYIIQDNKVSVLRAMIINFPK